MIRSCDWTPAEDAALLAEKAKAGSTHREISARLSARFGRPITVDAIEKRLARLRVRDGDPSRTATPPPAAMRGADIRGLDLDDDITQPRASLPPIDGPEPVAASEPPTERPSEDERERKAEHARFEPLVALVKKASRRGAPLTLEALCDELGLPPREARSLVEDAIEAGYALDVLGGSLEYRPPEPSRHYVPVATRYEPGEERLLGVASDWHVCSKHFEHDAFCRHIDWLLEQGVRDIIAPGDLVAGGYKFLKYEVTHAGIEDQSQKAAELIASRWGSTPRWHTIAGNHCMSFDVGIDATRMIQRHMQERGLSNFHYYGARGGRLLLGDTRIELWHPGGSLSYALTYKAQRHVDATAPEDRPHFLFVGHYHQEIVFRRGGVQVVLCGTFENGDSAFGRMIGGDVALGGWLIRYRMGADGRIAEMTPTFREYPQTKMQWVAA